MSNFRANSTLALPPKSYGKPKGAYYKGVPELDRFTPKYPHPDELYEEEMTFPPQLPTRHAATMGQSTGLLALHYESMRKTQERISCPTKRELPSMDRPWTATAGYSGFIPGKISNNVCGCSHKVGSQLAYEMTGKFYHPPMSGFNFTLGAKTTLNKSQSLPGLRTSGSQWRPSPPMAMS